MGEGGLKQVEMDEKHIFTHIVPLLRESKRIASFKCVSNVDMSHVTTQYATIHLLKSLPTRNKTKYDTLTTCPGTRKALIGEESAQCEIGARNNTMRDYPFD